MRRGEFFLRFVFASLTKQKRGPLRRSALSSASPQREGKLRGDLHGASPIV
jgi:hypothetical protein